MYSHFVMFYVRQFYFILFILPPAVDVLIWGNIIVPLTCMKHTLPSYVFWLLLINFALAKSWPAHSGCLYLLPSLSCGTDSLQIGELLWEHQQDYPGHHCRVNLTAWARSLWDSREKNQGSSTAQPSPRHRVPAVCSQAASSTDLHFVLQPR